MRSAAWLVLVAAACVPAQTTPVGVTPLSNDVAYGSYIGPIPDGDYACRIRDGGYDYPAFRCVVRSDGRRTMLEKVEGSVRFRGVILALGEGFRFDGEVYCPWGDCTEPVHAEFRSAGPVYHATFRPADARRDPMLITLAPMQAGYGGAGYGGAGYGGYGYGGAGYGGYGYGGYGYGGYRPYR